MVSSITTTTFLFFSSNTTTTTTVFPLCSSSTTTTTFLFSLLLFPFFRSPSSSSFLLFYLLLILLLSFHLPFFFPSRGSIKDCTLPSCAHFVAMFRVVNNNRGFFQLLADCPAHQRQFLLKTATPQQIHALVQVLCNTLMGHISFSEENKRIMLSNEDALLGMARPNVPYKTKKRVLIQEGSGFIY